MEVCRKKDSLSSPHVYRRVESRDCSRTTMQPLSHTLFENRVRSLRGGNMFHDSVAELGHVDACKQMFSRTQKNWCNCNVHLVHQSSPEVLLDGGDSSAKPDVLPLGRYGRKLQRGVDTIRDEVKGGAAIHRDWRVRVVGEDENVRVV